MRRKDEDVISWLERTCPEDWGRFLSVGEEEINEIVTLKLGDLGVLETVSESERCSNEPRSCYFPFVHDECRKCVKHCDCCGCMVHGCQGECK